MGYLRRTTYSLWSRIFLHIAIIAKYILRKRIKLNERCRTQVCYLDQSNIEPVHNVPPNQIPHCLSWNLVHGGEVEWIGIRDPEVAKLTWHGPPPRYWQCIVNVWVYPSFSSKLIEKYSFKHSCSCDTWLHYTSSFWEPIKICLKPWVVSYLNHSRRSEINEM